MKIAFAGTPSFAAIQLKALLASGHEIVVVYTQPDKPAGRGQAVSESPVKTLAKQHGIPIEQPNSLKTPNAQATLAAYHPDVMVVAAYGMLLPPAILTLPKLGCINVHASLLPRWRGASPIQHAILAGDKETGITLMQMDEGLDTGKMLAKVSCVIAPEDTTATLHDKLAELGANLLQAKIDKLAALKAEAQDSSLATYAGKITKAQAEVKWEQSAIELDRHVRAFNPWPVAYSTLENQMVRIWQASFINLSKQAVPGTILEHTKAGIVVATGKDGLLLTTMQLAGKKMQPTHDILRGHPSRFAIGKHFN